MKSYRNYRHFRTNLQSSLAIESKTYNEIDIIRYLIMIAVYIWVFMHSICAISALQAKKVQDDVHA